jgi:hypothetical protein
VVERFLFDRRLSFEVELAIPNAAPIATNIAGRFSR